MKIKYNKILMMCIKMKNLKIFQKSIKFLIHQFQAPSKVFSNLLKLYFTTNMISKVINNFKLLQKFYKILLNRKILILLIKN